MCCGERRNSRHCVCAVHKSAEKHAYGIYLHLAVSRNRVPFLRTWKKSFLLYHLFDEELVSCLCVEVLHPCRRTCSRCHSFAFYISGLVAALPAPPAVVCFKYHVFDQRSAAAATCSLFGFCKMVSLIYFSLRQKLVTEDSVDTFCLSDIARFLKTNALVVSMLKQFTTFLKTFCLYFATRHKKNKSTFARCVSWSCVIVTRLALHCVCDHEKFKNFKIALFFNNVLGILREILVLRVVFFRK